MTRLQAPRNPASTLDVPGSELEKPSEEPKTSGSVANSSSISPRVCGFLLGAAILGYVAVFLKVTFGLFERCAYMNFDLGIFDQAVFLISRGERPFVTLRGVHILGDHFSAVLYPLAPLYWLAPTAKTLLAVQAVALALGAVPVYALARLKSLAPPVALLFSLVYLCYPALQWSNTYEFHPDTLATLPLLGAFYFLHRDRLRPYLLCLALACLTKETVGLAAIFFGLYARWDGKPRFLWPSALMGAAFLAIASLTVRHFNDGNPSPYVALYEPWLKLTLPEALETLFRGLLAREMYAVKLLVPVLFLCLARPKALLPALPSLASNLLVLAHKPGIDDIEEYYTSLMTPFLLCAAVLGYDHLQKKLGFFGRAAILANLAIWSVGGAMLWGPFSKDLSVLYSHRTQADADETRRLLGAIPPTASVSAQMPLGAQISGRREIYHFPNPFQKLVYGGTRQALREITMLDGGRITEEFERGVARAPVEYVALSPNSQHFPISFNGLTKAATILLRSPLYGVEAVGRGVILFKRGASHDAGLDKLKQYTGEKSRDPERLLWAWLEKSDGLDE